MMPGDSSDGRREFERMQARQEAALERLRLEMEVAREEFGRAVERGLDPGLAAVKYRDRFGDWPEPKFPRKRRPPHGLDGGEPAPVKPRPNPKPLMDGAEAPIE